MALKLLVVEDDNGIRALLERLLGGGDYQVIWAKNSRIFGQISDIAPDVVILDEWLCNENGGDLCQRLKANPLTAVIPVILVSAMMSAKDFYKKAGADLIIRKPFDLADLKLVLDQF
jgi:DNA-binding response OmpR family regulator